MICESLESILTDIRACNVCQTHPRGKPLPHEPRPVVRAATSARIAICGQAPGRRVHESGIPFSDASGDRLRSWLGVTPDEFYDVTQVAIIPMGFCFPGYDSTGADLPPRGECAPLWRARLFAHLPQLELLVLVGRHAIGWHVPALKRKSVTHAVASWHDISNRPGLPAAFPLPHPSWRNTGWLKANPWFEADVLPVLKQRIEKLIR